MTVTLVQIRYSPWSEKARWALDHHRVPYRRIEYLTMIGEPLLRLRLGKLRGPATVPALIDRDQIFPDSWSIARHAEAVGSGASLFPADALETIRGFDEQAERLMAAGRARTTARTLESVEALREALPKPLHALGAAGLATAKMAARFLQKKYGTDARTLDEHFRTIEEELSALKRAIEGRDYLVGDGFTYADICTIAALQFVAPIDLKGVRLGPATRAAWTESELSARFADVLAWRDRVYARHR